MIEPESTRLEMANAGVRLVIELVSLVVFGYWGYSIGRTPGFKLGFAVAAPLIVALIWGVFGSPAAPYRLEYPWRLGLELLILGGAAAGLFLLDRPMLAVVFVVLAALNTMLLYSLGQA